MGRKERVVVFWLVDFPGDQKRGAMWALVTELLFSFVLLAFLVISCQNVLHIASGSVRSVLTYIHTQLDRELGEVEGVADEEENVTTRVVRRRVILKVQREGQSLVEEMFGGKKKRFYRLENNIYRRENEEITQSFICNKGERCDMSGETEDRV